MTEFEKLDQRSKEIFKTLVENYLKTGDPVGSKTLANEISYSLSSATIRNIMADLEYLGLIGSPHVSAGRLPTDLGLRFFVDGILEVQNLSQNDQSLIEQNIRGNENDTTSQLLARTGGALSTLSNSASLVLAHKKEMRIKHIDFVQLSNDQAFVILVGEDDSVENRLFVPPKGMTSSDMRRAANFVNTHAQGRTISELDVILKEAMKAQQSEVDALMKELIELGQIAVLTERDNDTLIVRGRSHLISQGQDESQIQQVQQLLDDLEHKRDLIELLSLTDRAQGVAVFIGSENKLFSLKGSSLVISPYMNGEGQIIGAVGVVGPTRLNYARIVPMVSYTAGLIGKMIDDEEKR